MSLGAFCLVLHGHLPWVLHHGRWPHGEDWLFEAASETWMPILEALDLCAQEGIAPGWTIGLTPILLEQLSHDRFKDGFVTWLGERIARAGVDEASFRERGEGHLAWLAERHAERYAGIRDAFEGIDRDIPAALVGRDGVELLTSNATHGFHQLILHDACERAQLRAGFATSERRLGHRPQGMWLPECAYRPDGWWTPPVVHGDARLRQGVAGAAAQEGCRYFFVDTHLVEQATPMARVDGDKLVPLGHHLDGMTCWNSVLEPHRVAEAGSVTDLTVLARCPDVSEQVWSGKVGYPGDGRYREFHKVHGLRGLRYWKVTSNEADLGDKHAYHPDDVPAALHTHADHFVATVKERLRGHHDVVGRWGVVCAPFDAELFGHWWYEGPRFLLEVARRMHQDPEIEALTVGTYLARVPADKAASMPPGTWGEGGDARVWFNDELRFYWEIAYRAEDRFLDLWHRVDWRSDAPGTELLTEAARQLLLLQSSDWPFVIHTRGAVDYGMRRILDHATRFEDLCNGVEDVLAGRTEDPVVADTLRRSRLLDPVFEDLELSWWS
jgi:1,4-alpha-glucan branching enzyme